VCLRRRHHRHPPSALPSHHRRRLQISEDKRVLTPYLGALEAGKIKSFVDGLAAGRAAGARPFPAGTASAGSLVAASGVEPWDGKDYSAPGSAGGGGEEFSLDDLDL
jgi:hypothetical protein